MATMQTPGPHTQDEPDDCPATRPRKVARPQTPPLRKDSPSHQSSASQPSTSPLSSLTSQQSSPPQLQTSPTEEIPPSQQSEPQHDIDRSDSHTLLATQRHRVPSYPMEPQYAPVPALMFKPCEGWPSFYLPERWRGGSDRDDRKTGWWCHQNKDPNIGLHEPFPIPFEHMELYIKRRARASEVDPDGEEHRQSCMEQFWRFWMYNEQWRRKMTPGACKKLWEAGVADKAPGRKYGVVPKGEGISENQMSQRKRRSEGKQSSGGKWRSKERCESDIDEDLLAWSG